MDKIKVMVNGMPGNMAVLVAKHALSDSRFDLIPQSLTGPEIEEDKFSLGDIAINLIKPENREEAIQQIKNTYPEFLSVDYSHPSAVNENAEYYCKNDLPFVMGTTGGNREALEETVLSSSIAAVIAPNMARQIVGFQAMMEYAADTFAGLFKGYSLNIRESHQHGKADTSGTAKAMAGYFNRLGLVFEAENIVMERDPEIQKSEWGVPEAYLTGHGWHTYSLVSDDKTVRFEFTHNVNGRDVYAKGTLEALDYLQNKINQGARGKVFTMIDVLKGS